MQQLVSITSQGQITIPASFRRELGLDKYPKASIKIIDKQIIVEPIPDLLDLAGILHDRATKSKTIDQIIKSEHEAVSKAVIKRNIPNK